MGGRIPFANRCIGQKVRASDVWNRTFNGLTPWETLRLGLPRDFENKLFAFNLVDILCLS
jgi:hypothetical protein